MPSDNKAPRIIKTDTGSSNTSFDANGNQRRPSEVYSNLSRRPAEQARKDPRYRKQVQAQPDGRTMRNGEPEMETMPDEVFTNEYAEDNDERPALPSRDPQGFSATGHNPPSNGLAEELETTREALRLQEEATRRLQQEWNRAASDLKRLHTSSGPQVDDDMLREFWSQLRYKIKDWSIEHFRVCKTPSKFTRRNAPYVLHGTCANFEKVFEVDYLRPAIVQAALWRMLVERVFDGHQPPLWTGFQCANAYRNLLRNLRPRDLASSATKEYHAWRSQTSSLMYSQCTSGSQVKEARQGQQDVVAYIVEEFKNFSLSFPETLRNDVLGIITDAIQLDAMLSRQRALYVVEPVDRMPFGFQFRPVEMDSNDGFKDEDRCRQPVCLMISPAIYKYGTSNGEYYDKPSVVVAKASVILDHTWWSFFTEANNEKLRQKSEGAFVRSSGKKEKKDREKSPPGAIPSMQEQTKKWTWPGLK